MQDTIKSNGLFPCFRHLYSVSPESGIIIGLDGAVQRLILNGETMVNLQRRALDSLEVIKRKKTEKKYREKITGA